MIWQRLLQWLKVLIEVVEMRLKVIEMVRGLCLAAARSQSQKESLPRKWDNRLAPEVSADQTV